MADFPGEADANGRPRTTFVTYRHEGGNPATGPTDPLKVHQGSGPVQRKLKGKGNVRTSFVGSDKENGRPQGSGRSGIRRKLKAQLAEVEEADLRVKAISIPLNSLPEWGSVMNDSRVNASGLVCVWTSRMVVAFFWIGQL